VAPAELLSARSGFGLRRQVDQDLSEGELMMIEMCAEVRRCSNHDPRSSRTTESHGHSNEEHSWGVMSTYGAAYLVASITPAIELRRW
jgi:hypothetical protein